jgi:hypothetical protein
MVVNMSVSQQWDTKVSWDTAPGMVSLETLTVNALNRCNESLVITLAYYVSIVSLVYFSPAVSGSIFSNGSAAPVPRSR